MLKIKFLGTRGSYPTGQQMISILLQSPATTLLVDAGSAALFADPAQLCAIQAVLLTHLHSDHALMLPHLVLARMRAYGSQYDPRQCPIYAPEDLSPLLATVGLTREFYQASEQIPDQIGELRIKKLVNVHPRLAYAYEFQHEGVRVVCSGDTSYQPELAAFCRQVDLLIVECTCSDERADHARRYGHMTPADVARLIQASGAKHTVLYHYDYLAPEAALAAVRSHLEASYPVTASVDGLELVVGRARM